MTDGTIYMTEETVSPSVEGTKVIGSYHGRSNGDRPTWYFPKKMSYYPKKFWLTVPGCTERKLVEHNGVRYEEGRFIVKQSSVSGRGMAILMPSSCKTKQNCYIEY